MGYQLCITIRATFIHKNTTGDTEIFYKMRYKLFTVISKVVVIYKTAKKQVDLIKILPIEPLAKPLFLT